MTDINPELKLHRARIAIDSAIEQYQNLIEEFGKAGLGFDDPYARGVIFGLMKARITIFTSEENDESWQARKEMFG